MLTSKLHLESTVSYNLTAVYHMVGICQYYIYISYTIPLHNSKQQYILVRVREETPENLEMTPHWQMGGKQQENKRKILLQLM